MAAEKPIVAVVMGSDSDAQTMQWCFDQLDALGIAYEARIMSAHRTPDDVHAFAAEAAGRGLKVLIAAAGMSAALAGALAANSTLPVIGVPMDSGGLDGLDAALSTMQMPPGVPVACMALGKAGATNAAFFAAEILALSDPTLAHRLKQFKADQAEAVRKKDADFRAKR